MSLVLYELNVTIETDEIEVQVVPPSDIGVKLEKLESNLVVDPAPDVIIVASGGIGPEGPEGPMGPASTVPGPPGPPGTPGTQTTYEFTQLSPNTTWNITHNLNRYPSVTVVDSGNSEIIPDVRYVSPDVLILTFANPTSGKAYLN
jgi:hypothetical protein